MRHAIVVAISIVTLVAFVFSTTVAAVNTQYSCTFSSAVISELEGMNYLESMAVRSDRKVGDSTERTWLGYLDDVVYSPSGFIKYLSGGIGGLANNMYIYFRTNSTTPGATPIIFTIDYEIIPGQQFTVADWQALSFSFVMRIPASKEVDENYSVFPGVECNIDIGSKLYPCTVSHYQTGTGSYKYSQAGVTITDTYQQFEFVFSADSVSASGVVNAVHLSFTYEVPAIAIDAGGGNYASENVCLTCNYSTPSIYVADSTNDAVISAIGDLKNYLDTPTSDQIANDDRFASANDDFGNKSDAYSSAEAALQVEPDLSFDNSQLDGATSFLGFLFNNQLLTFFAVPVMTVCTIGYVVYGKKD